MDVANGNDSYWSCQYCTFCNHSTAILCQGCGSQNPKKRAKSNHLLSRFSGQLAGALNAIDSALSSLVKPSQEQPNIHYLPQWICGHCQAVNRLEDAQCRHCQTNKPTSTWSCQRCFLQQPTPPVDFVCPLCRKRSPNGPLVSPPAPPPRPIQVPQTTSTESPDVDKIHDQIVAFCVKNQQSFIDDSFPHSNRSIGDISQLEKRGLDIVWLRPQQIYTKDGKVSPWAVFSNPKPTDIEQGLLGNCWLMSALALIAERPEILERIVLTRTYSHVGVYKIRLCVDGLWQTVFVDDFFPCHKKSQSMVFAVGRNNQLWVSLIEKALAKISGNYAALKAGRSTEGLAVLTGAPCEHIDVEVDLAQAAEDANAAKEMIWAQLLSAKDANFLMGCSCGAGRRKIDDKEYSRIGLMPRHAYSILDVQQHGAHKLLRIRNPWGTFVWKGEFSNGWPGWSQNDGLKIALDFERCRRETGTFWIPFERFCQYFDSVELAHIKDGVGWTAQRFPIDLSWDRPHTTRVTVMERCELCFTLFQRGARTAVDQVDIVVLVHKDDPSAPGQPAELVLRSQRRCLASVRTEDRFLEPGDYIVCATSLTHFCAGKSLPATLVVHSGRPVHASVQQSSAETLRRSLVQMTLAEATPVQYMPQVVVYQVNEKWSGLLVMIDNLQERYCVHAKVDCSQSQNVLSSRGDLVVADSIPPLHRQILFILTHMEPSQPYIVQHMLSQNLARAPQLGPMAVKAPGAQHEPSIDSPTANALHGPKPLYF